MKRRCKREKMNRNAMKLAKVPFLREDPPFHIELFLMLTLWVKNVAYLVHAGGFESF